MDLLQLARAASISLATIGVGNGFVFSFDGVEQTRMEYLIAYGLGVVGIALASLFLGGD